MVDCVITGFQGGALRGLWLWLGSLARHLLAARHALLKNRNQLRCAEAFHAKVRGSYPPLSRRSIYVDVRGWKAMMMSAGLLDL